METKRITITELGTIIGVKMPQDATVKVELKWYASKDQIVEGINTAITMLGTEIEQLESQEFINSKIRDAKQFHGIKDAEMLRLFADKLSIRKITLDRLGQAYGRLIAGTASYVYYANLYWFLHSKIVNSLYNKNVAITDCAYRDGVESAIHILGRLKSLAKICADYKRQFEWEGPVCASHDIPDPTMF